MQNPPPLRQGDLTKHLITLPLHTRHEVAQLRHVNRADIPLSVWFLFLFLLFLLLLQQLLVRVEEGAIVGRPPFLRVRDLRFGEYSRKRLDEILQGAVRHGAPHVLQRLGVIDHVGLLHQLLQSLRHGFRALDVDLVAEPLGEGEELGQLLVRVYYNHMTEEMEAVGGVDNRLEIPRLQAQHAAELVELGQSHQPAEDYFGSLQGWKKAFMSQSADVLVASRDRLFPALMTLFLSSAAE